MALIPKARAKAAYPIKQVTTWAISQLLFKAGISGWIALEIPGFKEAVGMLSVGDKYYFYIPSHLAWDSEGAPPTIPPNADVVYIIEMISKE